MTYFERCYENGPTDKNDFKEKYNSKIKDYLTLTDKRSLVYYFFVILCIREESS